MFFVTIAALVVVFLIWVRLCDWVLDWVDRGGRGKK